MSTLLKIAEQTTALTDEQGTTTTRVVVVLVLLEVLRQVLDALRQHCDLHLGGSGVTGVRRVYSSMIDFLTVCFKCHQNSIPSLLVARRPAPDARALFIRSRSNGNLEVYPTNAREHSTHAKGGDP